MQIAIITGSGRKGNLGFETAKQLGKQGYHVILAARKSHEEMSALVSELTDSGASASYVQMDITDVESVKSAAEEIQKKYGYLDVLINNAALMRGMGTIETQDLDEAQTVLNTNVIGTWIVTQNFVPLLKKSAHPRIVNVSSGAGSYEDPKYGLKHGTVVQMPSIYGISKLALNGLTVKMAKELKQYGILVNAVCPDITNTFDFGSWGRPVEVSAKSVIWAAALPDDSVTGGFFRDGKELPW